MLIHIYNRSLTLKAPLHHSRALLETNATMMMITVHELWIERY